MKHSTPPHDDSNVPVNTEISESVNHLPVLIDEVVKLLNPKTGESYLDLTAGYGGHATAIIDKTKAPEQVTLVDRDVFAFEFLQQAPVLKGATIVHNSFESAVEMLISENKRYDMILLDLGVSSPQLDNADRGFSFSKQGPLDMRMDRQQELSAKTIINEYSKEDLSNVLYKYGELHNSRQIASRIIENRPFVDTSELAQILKDKSRKVHPATLIFQAIRIAVNDELGQLERTLNRIEEVLADNGRLCIISFHSLEDRIVKNFLKDASIPGYQQRFELLTKKPISGKIKDVTNPRSRSAMLRAASKK